MPVDVETSQCARDTSMLLITKSPGSNDLVAGLVVRLGDCRDVAVLS